VTVVKILQGMKSRKAAEVMGLLLIALVIIIVTNFDAVLDPEALRFLVLAWAMLMGLVVSYNLLSALLIAPLVGIVIAGFIHHAHEPLRKQLQAALDVSSWKPLQIGFTAIMVNFTVLTIATFFSLTDLLGPFIPGFRIFELALPNRELILSPDSIIWVSLVVSPGLSTIFVIRKLRNHGMMCGVKLLDTLQFLFYASILFAFLEWIRELSLPPESFPLPNVCITLTCFYWIALRNLVIPQELS
jgi:hypothetical protein